MPSARSILLQNSKNHLAILRLIFFAIKFEVKFVNLTHRDLHLENANLNLRIAQQLLTCSGVREGLGEEGATLRK